MGESEHYDHCLTGDALRAASCDACRICFPPFGASPLTSENRCECLRLFNFRGFFDSTYLDNSIYTLFVTAIAFEILEELSLTGLMGIIMYAKIRAKNRATLFEITPSKDAEIKSVAQFI